MVELELGEKLKLCIPAFKLTIGKPLISTIQKHYFWCQLMFYTAHKMGANIEVWLRSRHIDTY
jgi:hypothetical protein